MERVISADRDERVPVFTGLPVRQFRRLVRIVAGRGGEQTGTGRRWSLPLADRVLLIAVYYRTSLTLRLVALQSVEVGRAPGRRPPGAAARAGPRRPPARPRHGADRGRHNGARP
ncbi:hypothetical protein AGRA3207_007381 [Actinomadura graeca]|uniref:Transposase Helix-turn-helix domain-containing protein n=1 Tax=Actinomadura graeca TaxID=2750812 RepID=A0ABX8R6E8_9ACTN|nr:hypothetical protein [Actinomadura graeca]QXJ25824.1 hypothetical protein AGRA3207_007381 [Actinomadura graeca]